MSQEMVFKAALTSQLEEIESFAECQESGNALCAELEGLMTFPKIKESDIRKVVEQADKLKEITEKLGTQNIYSERITDLLTESDDLEINLPKVSSRDHHEMKN